VSKIGVSAHVRTLELTVIAGLGTVLIALYVELTDRVITSLGTARRGPGRPPVLSDAELVCVAVAQVLLRFDDERRWLRAAPARVGHLFPRLLGQSEYNDRLKGAAGLMEAALRWLAGRTPSSGVAAADGRHTSALRRLAGDRGPLGPGWGGQLRPRRLPPLLLLGRQAHAGSHR
jgi:hypothetical protein